MDLPVDFLDLFECVESSSVDSLLRIVPYHYRAIFDYPP